MAKMAEVLRKASMSRNKIMILIIIALLVALFFSFGLGRYLTLTSLKANRTTLVELYESHRFAMAAVFIVVYIVQTVLSLPGAGILSLTAGAVFGVLWGVMYVSIGATSGAILAFLISRYLFRDVIQKRLGPRLETMNREIEHSGLHYLLFLRLVPIFPFFLINLAAGLTKIPLRTFFLGTMIGMIPGNFVFCNAGASLATITKMSDIAAPRVLGSFVLLGLFALIPVAYRKFARK
jgi:uncharacterized membrane protein YdjX (TVP38/TMEM64 family)